MSPSQPPEEVGHSSGSWEPANASSVTETGGPFTLDKGESDVGPMDGILAGSISLTLAGTLSESGPVVLFTNTFGTATAAAPLVTTTTLTLPRVDDWVGAF